MQIDERYIIMRQGRRMVLYPGLVDAFHEENERFLAAHPEFLGRVAWGIVVHLIEPATKENGQTARAHAVVTMANGARWEEEGDADPSNVNRMIAPHMDRMSQTRAKARALRDALNVGDLAVDETDLLDHNTEDRKTAETEPPKTQPPPRAPSDRAPAADPPRASPYKPVSANQAATIAKLSRLLGKPETGEGMTSAEASERIAELSHEYDEVKGQPPLGSFNAQEITPPAGNDAQAIPRVNPNLSADDKARINANRNLLKELAQKTGVDPTVVLDQCCADRKIPRDPSTWDGDAITAITNWLTDQLNGLKSAPGARR